MGDKDEIEKLIDTMISNSNELAAQLKAKLPASVADSVSMFQESNTANLKKIKDFLNGI